MSDCCSTDPVDVSSSQTASCPNCNHKGLKIKTVTPKTLLVETVKNEILESEQYRFCKDESCEVVYFDEQGRQFGKDQVSLPIFQKDRSDSVPVCYCFGFSRGDVVESVHKGEGTRIYDEIKSRVNTEGCSCETLNPQGSCCFGNVKNLTKKAALNS